MKRHQFLNHVIKLHWGDRTDVCYLEIGVRNNYTFRRVNSTFKCGVDPKYSASFRGTSDEFFKVNKRSRKLTFDLIFIDGLHQREQVVHDALNAMICLNPGGIVIVDDCRPREEVQQERDDTPNGRKFWCGDVWKAIADLRQDLNLDICVVDEGWGFGVVLPRNNSNLLGGIVEILTWESYLGHRREYLNLIPLDNLPDFLGDYGNGQNTREHGQSG